MFLKKSYMSRGSVIADAAISFPIFVLTLILVFSQLSKLKSEAVLYKRLCEEASKGISIIGVSGLELPFMITSGKEGSITAKVYYRPFAGMSSSAKESTRVVYYYPYSGERYHEKTCSTLVNNKDYERILLADALEKGLIPCALCKEGGEDYFK